MTPEQDKDLRVHVEAIGEVDTAIKVLQKCRLRQAANFTMYLRKHWLRIHNYKFLQLAGICIGSGAVESAIKQISRNVKFSGAQWNAANVLHNY